MICGKKRNNTIREPKAKQLVHELEKELDEYIEQSKNMDLDEADDARLVFARMAFYQGQAFLKIFERLDEIENEIKKLKV